MALRVVIVEDEPVISRHLAHLLTKINPQIIIIQSPASVADAVIWFNANSNAYDLIFMDIQLADGQSFDIFKQADIIKPVIFVTSYNQHAIEAFKNNGLDYILKPFDEQELKNALTKYSNWISPGNNDANDALNRLLQQFGVNYKRSFLARFRNKLIPVETAEIAWFYTSGEVVYAHTTKAGKVTIDHTMEALVQMLDPDQFFRANRQFIISRGAITEVEFFFGGRLLLKVTPDAPEKIIISKARANDIKKWMNR